MRRQIVWSAVVVVAAIVFGGGYLALRDPQGARPGTVTTGAASPTAPADRPGAQGGRGDSAGGTAVSPDGIPTNALSPQAPVPDVQTKGAEAVPPGAAATLPAAEKPLEGPMSPPGGPGAATGLQSDTGCKTEDPGEAFADLSWTVAEERGKEQRVVVTIFRDGFDTGNYEVSEPLDSGQNSLRWERFHGQAIHFWRVLTLHGSGWTPSETASFEGPTCIRDSDEEAPPRGPG